MWIVLLYPPWRGVRTAFPRNCPACREGNLTVHQHHRIPVANRSATTIAVPNFRHATRVKCSSCKQTFTVNSGTNVDNVSPRVPAFVHAVVVSCYCFGFSVNEIINDFHRDAYNLSRATAYRALSIVPGKELSRLHKQNERWRVLRKQRLPDGQSAYAGLWFTWNHLIHDGMSLDTIAALYRAVIFRTYSRSAVIDSVAWLDKYFSKVLRLGAIFSYQTRDALERVFPPYETYSFQHSSWPPKPNSPEFSYMVRALLRSIDFYDARVPYTMEDVREYIDSRVPSGMIT
jgi:hypothetical protein